MLAIELLDCVLIGEPFSVSISRGDEDHAGDGFAVAISLRANSLADLDVIVASDEFDPSSDVATLQDIVITSDMIAELLQLPAGDAVTPELLTSNAFELIVQGGGLAEGSASISIKMLGTSAAAASTTTGGVNDGERSALADLTSYRLREFNSSGHRTKLLCVIKSCKGKLWQYPSSTTESLTLALQGILDVVQRWVDDRDVLLESIALLQEAFSNPLGLEVAVCAGCRTFIPLSDSSALSAVGPEGMTVPFHSSCLLCADCHSPLSGSNQNLAGWISDDVDRLPFHVTCANQPETAAKHRKTKTGYRVSFQPIHRELCHVDQLELFKRIHDDLLAAAGVLTTCRDEAVVERFSRMKVKVTEAWRLAAPSSPSFELLESVLFQK